MGLGCLLKIYNARATGRVRGALCRRLSRIRWDTRQNPLGHSSEGIRWDTRRNRCVSMWIKRAVTCSLSVILSSDSEFDDSYRSYFS